MSQPNGNILIPAKKTPRAEQMATAQNLISQNFDRGIATTGTIMVGGTAYAMAVPLRGGEVITNVYVQCNVAGTGTSLFKAGIYSKSGATQYAVSADQSALFSSSGPKAVPLTATWTVPTDDVYMVVIVATAGTTLPTLVRGASAGGGTGQISSGAWPYATCGTSLSDLPAVTLAFATAATPICYWVGVA